MLSFSLKFTVFPGLSTEEEGQVLSRVGSHKPILDFQFFSSLQHGLGGGEARGQRHRQTHCFVLLSSLKFCPQFKQSILSSCVAGNGLFISLLHKDCLWVNTVFSAFRHWLLIIKAMFLEFRKHFCLQVPWLSAQVSATPRLFVCSFSLTPCAA